MSTEDERSSRPNNRVDYPMKTPSSSSCVACTTRGCVAPNADISLQSGRFWATVIASSSERLFNLRSCWIVFIHVVRGRPGGFLQSFEGEAVRILLASVSFGILEIWPNRERRRAWTIADRRGCPVVRLTSSFRTWWYHLIPNSFRRHHWSRVSILSTSLLVTAQHSEPYRKIGRMHCYTTLA